MEMIPWELWPASLKLGIVVIFLFAFKIGLTVGMMCYDHDYFNGSQRAYDWYRNLMFLASTLAIIGLFLALAAIAFALLS